MWGSWLAWLSVQTFQLVALQQYQTVMRMPGKAANCISEAEDTLIQSLILRQYNLCQLLNTERSVRFWQFETAKASILLQLLAISFITLPFNDFYQLSTLKHRNLVHCGKTRAAEIATSVPLEWHPGCSRPRSLCDIGIKRSAWDWKKLKYWYSMVKNHEWAQLTSGSNAGGPVSRTKKYHHNWCQNYPERDE